ncbi:ubinuclein-1 [Silurus meridionalis]|uniref:Ubinuclein-1-like n=1 Tax=Silurus meridionalis TaxID=175797 RepID=A0A8T0AEQ7_SILME|nr:ubinuclein-1 [Silurus meridionalis]KAF7689811.1 hypothetical protein HF521_013164 [Silurus meridionalis]
MATPHRIQFTTLSHPAPDPPLSPGLMPPHTPPAQAEETLSARIELVLFEPDDARCAEFHYPTAVRGAGRDGTLMQVLQERDGDGEELQEQARMFQQKYGGASTQRKDRVQDLVDMGYGYDDNDSFIDNSEAYDELVPACLTTKYGGFYINSGTLHFRPASGEEKESDDFEENIKPKKRKLKGGGEVRMTKKKKRRKEEVQAEGENAEHSVPSGNKKKASKKQKQNLSGMLKKFHKAKLQELHLFNMKTMEPAPAANHDSSEQLKSVPADLLMVLRDADGTDDIHKAVIEQDELLSDHRYQETRETSTEVSQASLPDGLPSALKQSLQELTQGICGSEEGKKMEMFAPEINIILLDVSVQRKELPDEVFSRIFSYLSSLLSCNKHTLVERATKLHLLELEDQLAVLIRRLEEAVCRVMPEQIHRFNHHCQAHSEAKAARLEAVKEKRTVEGSDEEEDDLSGKRVFGPRKRFRWNEEIRELVCEVVRLKMRSFELEPPADQSLEDYLKCFLEASVKTLWPRGWIQSRILLIETRRVHAHVTGIVGRKKSVDVPKSEKGRRGDAVRSGNAESKSEEATDVQTTNKTQPGVKSQKIPAQKICGAVSVLQRLSAEEMKPGKHSGVERDVYCLPQSLLCSTSMSLAAMEGSCGDPALPTPSLSHQTSSSGNAFESEVMKGGTPPRDSPSLILSCDEEPVSLAEICSTSRLTSVAAGTLQCSLTEQMEVRLMQEKRTL